MTTITWEGSGGTTSNPTFGLWDTPTNWDTGAVPEAGDIAVLPTGKYRPFIGDGVSPDNVNIAALVVESKVTLSLSSKAVLTIGSASNLSVSTIAGVINGYADVVFSNASVTFEQGARLDMQNTRIANEAVTLDTSLIVAGSLNMSHDTVTLGTTKDVHYSLTVYGFSNFTGVTFGGSGALKTGFFKHEATLSDVTIGGTATLANSGPITQMAGDLVLGDSADSSARLINAPTGIYKIADDSDIALGFSSKSVVANQGLLEKTGGFGTSVIAPAIINTGTVTAATGTLNLANNVFGSGNMTMADGAALEFGKFVVPTQTVSFAGADGKLILDDAHDFHAHLADFKAGDTIDLIGFATQGEKLFYKPDDSQSGGRLLIASGSQRADLIFNGQYGRADFHIASDLHGGTLLTYAPTQS